MTMESAFTDAGFNDIELGSELFSMLEVNEVTFKDPAEYAKLRTIAEFFNKVPDATFIASRVVRKAGEVHAKPLDHLASFVLLHQKRMGLQEQLRKTEEEIGFYE